jgi:manganese-dependent inorganic pyrophosphatase
VNSETQPKILVIGHKNPDTDSVVSALVYAQFRNRIENTDRYEGVTLGPLNAQTTWLLNQARTTTPRQIESIELRVSDLTNSNTPFVVTTDPLGKALTQIAREGISTIPVLSDEGKLKGILSDRIPECNYFHQFNTEDFLGVLFTLSDLVETFGLECWQETNQASAGKLTLDPETICAGDVLLSEISQSAMGAASDAGASAAIVCTPASKQDWNDVLNANPGLGVYRFTGTLMALTSQLSRCIPVENAMTSRHAFLHPDQPLNDVQSQILSHAYPLPVTDSEGFFVGLISRAELLAGKKPKVILVDHFEAKQAVKGLNEAEIIEILDHHRVGNLETHAPITVDCRPLVCRDISY